MCLCGMLAAEYRTLPDRQQAVCAFFAMNKAWLSESSRRAGPTGR